MKNDNKKNYFLEQVGDTAILQLYSDDFNQLNKEDRLKTYYFVEAALAGRDIYFDQNHRYALEIRNFLEEIIKNSTGIDEYLLKRIVEYTKLIWINSSQYNERSKKKFLPHFSFSELCQAAKQAVNNGAKLPIPSDGSIVNYLTRFENSIFNPDFESLITNKNPNGKNDMIAGSSNNFYYNVSSSDLENFVEKYPLNSRLIKKDNVIIELVFRTGIDNKNIPSGLYATELRKIIKNLKKSLPYADETQKKAISHLIEYFESGDDELFNQYNIEWIQDNSQVDLILGFIEVYKDPRGRKGSFEGIVYCINQEMTHLMQSLSQNAQYFENKAPWEDKYKKEHVNPPTALAVSVLFGTGDGGPTVPLGINLPNSDVLRERYGSKSVLLTNVLHALNGATDQKIIDEFVCDEAKTLLREYSVISENLHVALHEVLGHGSGKMNPDLKEEPAFYLKEYQSTIEEARADLTALYNIIDPKLVEIGLIPDQKVAQAEYWRYVTSDLTMLRRIKTDLIEDDHMRASHLIVTYIKDKFGAIESKEENGKIFLKITDMEQMFKGVKTLLSELMRIKAEGDYSSAKSIITKYGMEYNPMWRDQVIQRSQEIGLPEYFAFTMPTYVPIRNEQDEIIDVRIEYTDDFKTQMLKYSKKSNYSDF